MSADRRQLTILSCDIVDSTHYADTMDPEDFEVLMTVFFETCKAVVGAHRGSFAHHTGDGFTAYFGSPRTQGRNAQEAITCGRAVIEALSQQEFPQGVSLRVRIGIATGLVVLSTINRQNNSSDTFAVGAAVHLAARLQNLASPGAAWVDDTTHHLAERYFAFTDRGTHALKGFAEPTRVWQVESARSVEFRFEGRREHPSPLVGRDQELETLANRWRRAQQGAGQAVLVAGEAGIGKSRLVFEFIEKIAPGRPPLVFQCLEDHENDPLHPWINHMRHAAQVAPSESAEERRRKVGAFFDRSFPGRDWLRPFVLSLVAQNGDAPTPQDDATPARKLEALRSAIVDSIVALPDKTAQVVVVEDIHWIDPSSAEIVTSLVERAARARVLVIATCRMDRAFGEASAHVTHLPIDKLGVPQAVELASHIVGGTAITDSVLADVVERSDGIPLYIEEIARTVSATAQMQSTGATAADDGNKKRAALLPIPDSLQGTLLARLDVLGESKELAQVASVVGREFEVDVLAKLAARPSDALERDLRTLVESGLIRPLNASSTTKFEFKHALIREAAYNSLLRRDAVNLHAALAHIYEQDYPELRHTRPEMLAQHLTVSGRRLDAASLWLQAGISAKEMGTTVEAMTRLDRCLHCLDGTDSSPDAMAIKMRCQMARGAVINSHFGPVEQGASAALSEAAALAERLQDESALVESLISLSIVKFNSGDFSAASLVAQRMIDYGARQGNERAAAIGMMSAGMCSFTTGRFDEARARLKEALVLQSGGNERAATYEGLAMIYLALTAHILGNAEEATELRNTAIQRARRRRASDLAAALGNSLYLLWMQGDVAETRRTATELANLAEEKGFPMWYHHARFFLGWADALGDAHAGLDVMEASMTRFRSAQELVEQSFFYGVLAERYLAIDCPQRALENVEDGLQLVSRLGERFFEAPLLWLKARCLQNTTGSAATADIATLFARAERLAKEQGAVAWQRLPESTLRCPGSRR
jgi:class 3 adenylate cyclase/tetratricopeptide (TPR) repeat protein